MGMLSSSTDNPGTQANQLGAPAPDPAKDMYHDYLTNPNSTYGQDPTLAPQLKQATAPGVTPGSLTGDPDAVARQGLKPEAYSNLYGGSSTPASAAGGTTYGNQQLGGMSFTHYNGQDVRTDDGLKIGIADSANIYNKAEGTSLTPQQYDAMMHPDTYGARWGVPEGMMQAAAPALTYDNAQSLADFTKLGYSPVMAQALADNAASRARSAAVGTAAPAGGAAAAPPSSGGVATYDAAQTQVTPGMLAAGNLNSIMDPNSPLMVQAATRGNQESNARGLQNSSIGISAAQDSMLRAATPLALQDAQTQANVALSNTGALNASGQFNAGAKNTSTLTGQQLASQQKIAGDQIAGQERISQGQIAGQERIAQGQVLSQQQIAQLNANTSLLTTKMSTEAQASLATLNNTHQKLIQSNSQAATAVNNYAATVANIQASKDMDGPAKQAAVDAQTTILRNELAALESQSGQNLEQFFPMVTSTPPADTGTDSFNPKATGAGEGP